MRLYNAICAWIEARAEQMRTPKPATKDHKPQGNNFAQAERSPDIRIHELNNDERPDTAYGRSISLRWHPKN